MLIYDEYFFLVFIGIYIFFVYICNVSESKYFVL